METDTDGTLELRPRDGDAAAGIGRIERSMKCTNSFRGFADLAARWAGVEIDLGALICPAA